MTGYSLASFPGSCGGGEPGDEASYSMATTVHHYSKGLPSCRSVQLPCTFLASDSNWPANVCGAQSLSTYQHTGGGSSEFMHWFGDLYILMHKLLFQVQIKMFSMGGGEIQFSGRCTKKMYLGT